MYSTVVNFCFVVNFCSINKLNLEQDYATKQQHAFYFNRWHRMRTLPSLKPGDPVLVKLDGEKQLKTPATVMGQSSTQCSYMISSPEGGVKRCNRCHLQFQRSQSADTCDKETVRTNDPLLTQINEGWKVTRSGRVSKPVQKLDL